MCDEMSVSWVGQGCLIVFFSVRECSRVAASGLVRPMLGELSNPSRPVVDGGHVDTWGGHEDTWCFLILPRATHEPAADCARRLWSYELGRRLRIVQGDRKGGRRHLGVAHRRAKQRCCCLSTEYRGTVPGPGHDVLVRRHLSW